MKDGPLPQLQQAMQELVRTAESDRTPLAKLELPGVQIGMVQDWLEPPEAAAAFRRPLTGRQFGSGRGERSENADDRAQDAVQ